MTKYFYYPALLLICLLKSTSAFSQGTEYYPSSITVKHDTCGVFYTNPEPDLSLPLIDPFAGGSSSIQLDVNGDGINDILFSQSKSSVSAMGFSSRQAEIYGLDSCSVCISPYNTSVLDSLRAGDVIDNSRTWGQAGFLYYDYWSMGGGSTSYGYWLSKSYYAGLRIKNGSVVTYGWLNITISSIGEYAITGACTVSGINDHTNELNVYPVVAGGSLSIWGNITGPFGLELFDAGGKQLLGTNTTTGSAISTGDLAKGMYIVVIRTKDLLIRRKIVIMQ